MEHIEDVKKQEFTVGEENAEYQIHAKKFYVIKFIDKMIHLLVGVSISYYVLYDKCLFSLNCNPIATVFFSILALSCFQAAGFPIEKLMNIKLT